jgi:alpha-amylase
MAVTDHRGRPRRRRVGLAVTGAVALLATGCTDPAGPSVGREDAARGAVGVQLFQWTWPAIARECSDYLGPAGYDYVLTSPPQEHVRGEAWWVAYQPVSHRIESRLGSREEFESMVSACDEAGVKVVADAVINHMTGSDAPGVGWAGSSFEHYEYPGLYSDADGDFHHCGLAPNDDIANYQDREQVQTCELVNLADLATETDGVRETIVAYLEDLLSLGVAGFRIDAAKHMPAEDVAAITRELPRGTVVWSEVIRGAGEPVQPGEYTEAGQVFEFGYPTQLKTVFDASALGQFEGISTGEGLLDTAEAVVFVDNHDTERNGTTLSYDDAEDYALANVLMLAAPYGLPVVYSGYAFPSLDGRDLGPQQDGEGAVVDATCPDQAGPGLELESQRWVCQHRWPQVRRMVAFRQAVGEAELTDWWEEGPAVAFGRGERGFVVVNTEREPLEGTWTTSLAPGDYCDVQTGPVEGDGCAGQVVTVNEDGSLQATVPARGAVVLHVDARPGGGTD